MIDCKLVLSYTPSPGLLIQYVFVQISYTLGCYYFTQDDTTRAKQLFSRCQELLSSLPTPHTSLLVKSSELRGYLFACGGHEAGIDGEQLVDNLSLKLELTRLSSVTVCYSSVCCCVVIQHVVSYKK